MIGTSPIENQNNIFGSLKPRFTSNSSWETLMMNVGMTVLDQNIKYVDIVCHINLILNRKLGIHDSITRHPYACITRKVTLPPKKTFNEMIKIGFHSKVMEWTWTDEDINILKESFQSLMSKQDWIHTKNVYHWFSHSVFNGRISKKGIKSKINEINHSRASELKDVINMELIDEDDQDDNLELD